jgi:hypothetical protein
VLDLDTVAWDTPGVRATVELSRQRIDAFTDAHDDWVIEGCYADLAGHALPRCTRLVFLDPGVEACQHNNRRRPWEPHKYASKADQDANLDMLQQWVADYYTRDDEYSHAAHLRLFQAFDGDKQRVTQRG